MVLNSSCIHQNQWTTVEEESKPRVIITTDGEFDDANSLIHYMLYADQMDLAGLIQTSSFYHWEGRPNGKEGRYGSGEKANRWPGTRWMDDIIDAYEKVFPNLRVHSPNYPTADSLRSVVRIGNVGYEGEMDGPTEGSTLIKECILDDDERTLFIQNWGGTNTCAMALKQIEDEYKGTPEWKSIYQKVSKKVIFTACAKQDLTYDSYIAKVWKDIPFIDTDCQEAYGYLTKNKGSDEMKRTVSAPWMYKNIDSGHGPLLDLYMTWGDGTVLSYEPDNLRFGTNDELLHNAHWWGALEYERYDFISEGDSPTYFAFLDTGLQAKNLEDFIYGTFAGRYTRKPVTDINPNSWELQKDNDNVLGLHGEYQSIMKWIPDIQHDFAARADWCIKSVFNDANHHPNLRIREGNNILVKSGESVIFHAETTDPDGDNVSVCWWNYEEAGTYKGARSGELLMAHNSDEVCFFIPEDIKSGETIHILARAEDDGEHHLTYYQRIILTAK